MVLTSEMKSDLESYIITKCAMYVNYELCNLVDYSIFSISARLLFLHLFYLDNELNIYNYEEDQIQELSEWEDMVEYFSNVSFSEQDVDQAKIHLQNAIDKLLSE